METDPSAKSGGNSTGLDLWMARVPEEWNRVRHDFDPQSVHDLRVALRRCRSIAEVFMAFDPHPAWKLMRIESKRIFRQLGALRDTQVMLEWIQRLSSPPDPTAMALGSLLASLEDQLKESASETLRVFSQKKWASWTRLLPGRLRRVPPEGMAFQHLALECWMKAHALHRQALRNRSHASYHRLRIGLKKFRYLMENFLPSLNTAWGADLRKLQDILGEMHDLHVLWRTALSIKAFPDDGARLHWQKLIAEESSQRLESYRAKMLGASSLWRVWRSELPDFNQIHPAALARMRAWASFRDPDFAHSEHVAGIALQIYDGLNSLGLIPRDALPDGRFMLESAALAHDVGLYGAGKKHQLLSYKMIRRLDPSPGWSAEALQGIASIARFHRGALPRIEQKAFAGMSPGRRESIILLSGILRLADAMDHPHQRRVRRLVLRRTGEAIRIGLPEYSEGNASAERLAASRHLLETACGLPVLIQPLESPTEQYR